MLPFVREADDSGILEELLKNSEKIQQNQKLIYHTRAIIGRSWLQAALEYKPYIRTEFS